MSTPSSTSSTRESVAGEGDGPPYTDSTPALQEIPNALSHILSSPADRGCNLSNGQMDCSAQCVREGGSGSLKDQRKSLTDADLTVDAELTLTPADVNLKSFMEVDAFWFGETDTDALWRDAGSGMLSGGTVTPPHVFLGASAHLQRCHNSPRQNCPV